MIDIQQQFIFQSILLFLSVNSNKPILRTSCIDPIPNIRSFCNHHQSTNVNTCIDDLSSAVKQRCSTWLDTDQIELPISFENDPKTTCALPVVVDGKSICVITQDRAAHINRNIISTFGHTFCTNHDLDLTNQCPTLIESLHSISKKERVLQNQKDASISSVVSQDGSLPSIYPTGNLDWYYPNPDPNPNPVPETRNEWMQANWVRNNGHQTLRHGIFQIIAPVTIHNVCISIARYGDVTSNSAPFNFGCLKMNQKIDVLIRNVPYGPHRIILDGYDGNQTHRSRIYLSMEVSALLNDLHNNHNNHNNRKVPILNCNRIVKSKKTLSKSHTSSISLLTLVNRGKLALQNALKSWETSGLLDLVQERIAFVQQYSKTNQQTSDPRVLLLLKYHFKIIGVTSQQGISKGILRGISACSCKNILFVEEDFVTTSKQIVSIVTQSEMDLDANLIDVVRLRDTGSRAGTPNCANIWKKKMHFIKNTSINQLSWLDAAVVNIVGGHVKESNIGHIWRCGHTNNTICAFSNAASWTNNPFLIQRDFFLKNIAAVAAIDSTNTLEAAVSFSKNVWSDKCFVVGQSMMEGSFTHMDVDKKQYEQTICPDVKVEVGV